MKVMYIIHSCIPGGATLSLLNLIKGVRQANIDVVVVHPKPDKKDEQLIEKLTTLGCRCITTRVATSFNCIRKGILNHIKFILRYFLIFYRKIIFYKDLNNIIKKEKPDIIHTNTGVVHEGYLIAKKYNIPHIWHLREYQTLLSDFKVAIFPSKKIYENMLKSSYTFSITKGIQRHFNIDNIENSFVVNEPVMSISETGNNCNKDNYFLVANQIVPQKGLEDIINAFFIFSNKYHNFKLVILGFGNKEYINKLKNLCNDLNIASKVDFLGFKDDVFSYMKKSKALIVGSFYEGFGRMTAEANMLGVPVIGRNMSGTKEILNLTKGGFLFDTVEQMADYMKLIASKSDLELNKFMEKPKSIAIESYSNEQHIKRVLELYKVIVKNGTSELFRR